MMKKSLLFIIIGLFVFAPSVQAAYDLSYLPESDYYDGVSYYSDGVIEAYMEFAVYDTSTQTLDGYDGSQGQYVYAYQLFNVTSTGLGVASVSIMGFEIGAVVDPSLDASETLGGNDSFGMETTTGVMNATGDAAVWEFEGGVLAQNDGSWFLMIYSDNDYVDGSYEVTPASDVPVPGDETDVDTGDTTVPEPATLALLLAGGLLSLRRKK